MNYDAKIDTLDGDREAAVFNPLADVSEEDRRSRRRMWIIAAIAGVVLIGLWFLMHKSGQEGLGGDVAGQAPVVSVIAPGNTTITNRISATGTLAARRQLPVGSVGEGGQVERVLVEPGEWVKTGQVLAVINRSVQAQQQQSLAAETQVARANGQLAQANLDRALKLVDRGFISKADVDRLTATRDAALARVQVAQAKFSERQARNRRLNIVAPAGGLILERNIEPGQVVGGSSGVLFRIARGGEMELLADLSEGDLAVISPGVSAEVTPVGSEKSFTGHVWQVSPVIDPQSRQGRVRIALAYSSALRPGGFASVKILSGTIIAPLLPEVSVLSDNKGNYVYIVDKDNKVQRRNVKTGSITGDGIAVIEGLSGTEHIVVRAGAFLSAGETVKPKLTKNP